MTLCWPTYSIDFKHTCKTEILLFPNKMVAPGKFSLQRIQRIFGTISLRVLNGIIFDGAVIIELPTRLH